MKERTSVRSGGLTITTKYLGPTNTKGARIKAHLQGWGNLPSGNVTKSYDYALDPKDAHAAVAVALVNRLKSNGYVTENVNLVQGSLDKGYAFVLDYSEV